MKFDEVKPEIAYRHIKCGQATMAGEVVRQDDKCFCVYCGRYYPEDDFIHNAAKD